MIKTKKKLCKHAYSVKDVNSKDDIKSNLRETQ